MKARGLYGLVVVFLLVLLSIFIYNRFLAKAGESIATLGKKTDAAAAFLFAVGASLAMKLVVDSTVFVAMLN
jgi:hypothetical protein